MKELPQTVYVVKDAQGSIQLTTYYTGSDYEVITTLENIRLDLPDGSNPELLLLFSGFILNKLREQNLIDL